MNGSNGISLVLLSAAALLANACDSNDNSEDPTDPIPPTTANVTWHQDIAPIIHDKCVECHHSPGGIAPFSLESYEDAGPIAGFMLQKVADGEMPPWSARDAEDCEPEHDWKDDARVTDAQLATLQAWVDEGAPEGDASTAAALPDRTPPALAGVTHTMSMDPYTTSGFDDELLCFILDPQLETLQYMTGVEIIPSNLQVAHHATLTVVPPAQAQAVRDLTGPDGSFPCTGGTGVEGGYSLGIWVPGTAPFETPVNTGTPVAPGSLVLLNMHYHPTGFDHEPDQTQVKLRMTEQTPEETFLFIGLGNAPEAPILLPGENDGEVPRFFIPANVDNHRETMAFTIDTPLFENKRSPIVAITPHMHYVGRDMQVTINHAAPVANQSADECLVNVKNWDFDWQRTYNYDAELSELPTVTNGDTITLRCDYNNTIANPFVQRMLEDEGLENPVDIFLGEETTDEMCVALIGIVF
jgi:hypothetical protein